LALATPENNVTPVIYSNGTFEFTGTNVNFHFDATKNAIST
jgi:hypothetical protein